MRIVYDCEIIRCIPQEGVDIANINDGLEYCGGWDDFKNMGISVICAADIDTGHTRIFLSSSANIKNKRVYPPENNVYDFYEFTQNCTEIWGFNKPTASKFKLTAIYCN